VTNLLETSATGAVLSDHHRKPTGSLHLAGASYAPTPVVLPIFVIAPKQTFGAKS